MKKIFSMIAVFSALLTAFSCGHEEQPAPKEEAVPQLQGIQVMPRTNYLVIGDTAALEVQYAPETAKPGTVVWSSLDENIATVSADGVVTAKSTGVVLVMAEVDGKVSSSVVNVVGERVPATAIVLSKTEASIIAGRSTQIKAHLEPENTTDKLDIRWSSSDEQIATVNYGVVKGAAMGEVNITATQGDLSAVCKVSVGDKIKLQDRSSSWTFAYKSSWQKDWWGSITGALVEITLESCDAALHYFQIVDADKPVDIEAVAVNVDMQVEEYQDAGRDPSSLFSKNVPETKSTTSMGEKYAYVLGYDEEFGFTGEYAIYQFTAAEPDPVHATGIQFTAGWYDDPIEEITLAEGKTLSMFSAVLLPEDCTDTGSISFKSSDESIVTLSPYYDRYYTVRAGAPGETTIVATFNDLEASIRVTVTGSNVPSTDIQLTPASATVEAGKTVVLTATLLPANHTDNPTLSWESDNEAVATVSGGVVTGVSEGSAKITVRAGNLSASSDVTVTAAVERPEGKVVSMGDNYFPVNWPANLATLDEVTMEGWVYGNSFLSGGNDNLHVMMGVEGIFQIRFSRNSPELIYGTTKRENSNEYNEGKVSCSNTLDDQKWYHLAATYENGGDVILYIDGEPVGSAKANDHGIDMNGVGAGWGNLPEWIFFIGVGCQTERDFDGSLAHLRVWKSVRTAEQIKADMRNASVSGSDLIGYWKFDEGSGNIVQDYSGAGRHITAKNTLVWIDGTMPF